jgi:hypothetical protein
MKSTLVSSAKTELKITAALMPLYASFSDERKKVAESMAGGTAGL